MRSELNDPDQRDLYLDYVEVMTETVLLPRSHRNTRKTILYLLVH